MNQVETAYVYRVSPIDWWLGWSKPSEILAAFGEAPYFDDETGCLTALANLANEIATWIGDALVAFKDAGWEGDIRQGPYLAPLPFAFDEGAYMVALKQDNNGTTFIWSPVELPWLEEHTF